MKTTTTDGLLAADIETVTAALAELSTTVERDAEHPKVLLQLCLRPGGRTEAARRECRPLPVLDHAMQKHAAALPRKALLAVVNATLRDMRRDSWRATVFAVRELAVRGRAADHLALVKLYLRACRHYAPGSRARAGTVHDILIDEVFPALQAEALAELLERAPARMLLLDGIENCFAGALRRSLDHRMTKRIADLFIDYLRRRHTLGISDTTADALVARVVAIDPLLNTRVAGVIAEQHGHLEERLAQALRQEDARALSEAIQALAAYQFKRYDHQILDCLALWSPGGVELEPAACATLLGWALESSRSPRSKPSSWWWSLGRVAYLLAMQDAQGLRATLGDWIEEAPSVRRPWGMHLLALSLAWWNLDGRRSADTATRLESDYAELADCNRDTARLCGIRAIAVHALDRFAAGWTQRIGREMTPIELLRHALSRLGKRRAPVTLPTEPGPRLEPLLAFAVGLWDEPEVESLVKLAPCLGLQRQGYERALREACDEALLCDDVERGARLARREPETISRQTDAVTRSRLSGDPLTAVDRESAARCTPHRVDSRP